MPRKVYRAFPFVKDVEWVDPTSNKSGTMSISYIEKTPKQLEIELSYNQNKWQVDDKHIFWTALVGDLPTEAELFAKLRDSKDSFAIQIKSVDDPDSYFKFHFEAYVTFKG